MKKLIVPVLLFILTVWSAAAIADASQPVRPWPENLPLPAFKTPQERMAQPLHPSDDVTPPPSEPVSVVPEFGLQEGVQLVYPGWWGATVNIFISMARECQEVGVVYIVVPDVASMSQCNSLLESNGVPLNHIEYQIHGIEGIWSRDYGAHYVWGQNSGEIALVDWQYYDERPNDDEIPDFQANLWHMKFYETALYHEGGNYMSDGHGTAMCSDVLYLDNPSQTHEWCDQQVMQYYGATSVHVYTRIPYAYDATGHIDLWAKMLNDTTVMVAQLQVSDPNYQMIEDHAAAMGRVMTVYGRPFNIVRCPMPPPYWYGSFWMYYKSFLNSLIFNGKVLVPVYNTEPSMTTQALAAYQAAMPNYEIIGIYSDDIAPAGGAIHCTTIGVAEHLQDYVHNTDVNLTAVNPPIIIPPGGGSFQYNTSLHNLENDSVFTEIWAEITIPHGTVYGPVLQKPVTLPVGATISRLMTQAVPGFAPAGNYIFKMYAGSHLPRVVNDSSYFAFTKSGAGGDFGGNLTGWSWSEQETEPISMTSGAPPESFAVLKASPNPFNPTTIASFELRVPSQVRLTVWDTSGRLVATLVEGWRETGSHQVTFDGSGLAGGIYFARLETGTNTMTEKLVLMK